MSLVSIAEVDLDTSMPNATVVHAKQYDTARVIACHLMQNGQPWVVPNRSGILGMVSYKKSDRIGGFYDQTSDGNTAVTVDGSDRSTIYLSLDEQVLTTAGNVSMEVAFYDTSNGGTTKATRLSTFAFLILVEAASLQELDLASNPYFNILAEDISAVLEAKASMTGMTASATTTAAGTNASVAVTGGQGGAPYNLAFGIPRGNTGNTGPTATPVSTEYAYAVSSNGSTPPADSSSDWKSRVEVNPNTDAGKYVWSRAITTWSNQTTTTVYTISYLGRNGDGSTIAGVESINNMTGAVYMSATDLYAVSYDTNMTQTLSAAQKAKAISNIGAVSSVCGVGGPEVTLEAGHVGAISYTTNAQTLTDQQRQNSRTNLRSAGYWAAYNVSVTSNYWASDTSQPGYRYKATIPISGFISEMICDVIFATAQATSNNFAPVCHSYNGGIYIYAASAPASTFEIPAVIGWIPWTGG